MNSMKSIIKNHNLKILNKTNTTNKITCNYKDKQKCPLDQNCLTRNIIYQANITSDEPN